MNLKTELGFDLYGRYALIKDIIMLNGNDKDSILDVGGRGNLLKKFMPTHKVVYLDPFVDSEDTNFVKGDGCDMPFEDKSFDWVVSADVFEHIPHEKRERFVSEHLRVAKKGIVIAAPFFSDQVMEAEISVNELYKSLNGPSHPWLKEHILNGLPDIETTINYPCISQYQFDIYGNNSLTLWTEIISSMMLLESIGEPFPEHFNETFNTFYNFDLFDKKETYRKLLFVKKDDSLKSLTKESIDKNGEHNIKKATSELSKNINNLLAKKIVADRSEIEDKRIIIEQKDNYINELRVTQIADKQILADKIDSLEKELTTLEKQKTKTKGEFAELSGKIDEANRKNIDIAHELNLKSALVVTQKDEIEKLHHQLKVQGRANKILAVKSQKKEHQLAIEANRIIDAEKNSISLKEKIESQDKEIQQLLKTENSLSQEIFQLKSNIGHLKKDLLNKESIAEANQIEIQRLQQKISRLALRFTAVNENTKILRNEKVQLLNSFCQEKENILLEAKSKYNKLESELSNLQAVLDQIRSKFFFKVFYKRGIIE